MGRCPDCNKFVSYEQGEPEVQSSQATVSGEILEVEVEVRIVNQCAECSTEMAEATIEGRDEVELPEGWRFEETPGVDDEGGECMLPAHSDSEFEVDEGSCDSTSRSEGKGRGVRTFYGAVVHLTITHPDFPDWSHDLSIEVEERAGAMEMMN